VTTQVTAVPPQTPYGRMYPPAELWVDGEQWERWPDNDGCRSKWISPDGRLFAKVDDHYDSSTFNCQANNEASLYEQIKGTPDEPHFVPILHHFESNGFRGVIQPYLPDMQPADRYGPHQPHAIRLREKYRLTDFGSHQWKHVGDSFIIHDYGMRD
jgi:hypothetical protein